MEKFKILPKEKISSLPKTTGVYAFLGKKEFLYIGKALNIKERVKTHFSSPTYRDNLFLDKVEKIGYIKTGSEIESLILEAQLIKKYFPKFNIAWRDDKKYFYVAITKEDFPRVFLTHQKEEKENIKYIGPFISGKAIKQTLNALRKIFPFRSCKKIPKKPCLWYQLQRCPAPCLLKSQLANELKSLKEKIKKESKENTKNLIKFLCGKKKELLKDFKKKMKSFAKAKEFEKAGEIRDKIFALEKVLAHTKVIDIENEKEEKSWPEIKNSLKKIFGKEIDKIEAYDVSNIQGKNAVGSMVAFVKGLPEKKLYRKFKIKIAGKPNDTAMIKEVIKRRFSHKEWKYPELILIDGGKAQLNSAIDALKSFGENTLKKIKVCALAKKHNKLFLQEKNSPLLLKDLPKEISNLILNLRDEAHRFAIEYHKKLRLFDLKKNF